jgi:adenylate cyclase
MGIDLQVRIGIHSGPLVAGVIGEVKPFYDIWGDTVNIASRMESHGMPNRLHISDDVRQALTSSFELEERGHIDIKNRGQILTWFVNGTA